MKFNPPSRSAAADEKVWFNSPILCIGNMGPGFYSGVYYHFIINLATPKYGWMKFLIIVLKTRNNKSKQKVSMYTSCGLW
jgi:hypothetical protein